MAEQIHVERNVYYSTAGEQLASFLVCAPGDGKPWEVCRAQRSHERHVVQPMVHGCWLDAGQVAAVILALQMAAAWIGEVRAHG